MSSISPRPRQVYLRDDGDGGLDFVVVTSERKLEVQPIMPADAARWLNQLAEYVERRFRQQMVKP